MRFWAWCCKVGSELLPEAEEGIKHGVRLVLFLTLESFVHLFVRLSGLPQTTKHVLEFFLEWTFIATCLIFLLGSLAFYAVHGIKGLRKHCSVNLRWQSASLLALSTIVCLFIVPLPVVEHLSKTTVDLRITMGSGSEAFHVDPKSTEVEFLVFLPVRPGEIYAALLDGQRPGQVRINVDRGEVFISFPREYISDGKHQLQISKFAPPTCSLPPPVAPDPSLVGECGNRTKSFVIRSVE